MARILRGLRAFLYARVSKDQLKRRRSVSQQIDAGKHTAEDFEVASLRIYDKDNDKSASIHGKKFREDWHRMMADIAAGECDLVIFWEISRGSRTASEGVAFVDLCSEQGVLVHVIDEGGTYDAREPSDRKRLLDMFNDAEFESGKTRKRILRDKEAIRELGLPDGKIPFGHRRLYHERTGELIRQEPDPLTRDCIREAVKRVRKGQSLRRILTDFNKRHEHDQDCPRWVPTIAEGSRWRHDNIRRVLMNPAHIGMRRDPHWKPGSAGDEFLSASWDPLFEDPEWVTEWWAAYRILNDENRATSRSTQVQHLVSYFMTCYECNRRVGAGQPPGKRKPRYQCQDDPKVKAGPEVSGPGCTSVVAPPVDDLISELAIKRLARPDVIAAAGADDDANAAAARARAVSLQAKLDEFWESAMRTDGGITLAKYEQAAREIEPQIAAAKAAAKTAAAPPLLREFLSITQGAGEEVVRQVWYHDFELEARREIVKLLFESIQLKRGRSGRVPFDPQRIKYKWRKW
jgi:site-specific DNA recombinase